MDKYFYHGVGEFCYGAICQSIEVMIKILNEGIINRNKIRNYEDEKYNHVCLYRKNDDYEYNFETILSSARGSWIDGGFVFIISPSVEAFKVETSKGTGFDENGVPFTNLIDEWRSFGDIPVDKIEGIALPFQYIEEYFSDDVYDDLDPLEDKDFLRERLSSLIELANSRGLIVADSCVPNFTDILDEDLSTKKGLL